MTSGWYLTNDKAVIMIAHRLKTVQKAERIFVLENGKPYSCLLYTSDAADD